MIARSRPWIVAVTDRRRLAPEARTVRDEMMALARWVDAAVGAGIDAVQIRERDFDSGKLREVTRDAVTRSTGTTTLVIVNDRPDVAVASGAGGVHLPAAGLPAVRVREIRPSWILGRSVHAADSPMSDAACDYVIFGTVFETLSKRNHRPSGVEALRRMARETAVPVIAIGGITLENARLVVDAGAVGVAAIGLFLPPARMAGTVDALRSLLSSPCR